MKSRELVQGWVDTFNRADVETLVALDPTRRRPTDSVDEPT